MNRRVRRTLRLAAAIAVAGLLLSGLPVGAQQSGAGQTRAVEGRALDATPESRAEGTQAIDAAVAAAVIGAISSQFGERKVEVKLDTMQSDPVNLIDQRLSGDGRLRIGDDEEWLPLRFSALYDSTAVVVAQPHIVIGGEGQGNDLPTDSPLARALQATADARLQQEFAQQAAHLKLERVREISAGKRYVRLEGVGAVDFGKQGSSVANVRALYDRNSREWLQLAYELGAATVVTDQAAASN